MSEEPSANRYGYSAGAASANMLAEISEEQRLSIYVYDAS